LSDNLKRNEIVTNDEVPSNQPFHRIAARVQILLKPKGLGGAANGDQERSAAWFGRFNPMEIGNHRMKRPAIFLDRDGTIIEDVGFLRDVAEVDFYPQTYPALRRLSDFALFIVTNQTGIAKGHVRAEEVCAVNDYVVRRLAEAGIRIRAVYCCPHQRTDECECMKPKPYFLKSAERDHEIDLRGSFVVGDHPSDVELAHAVGAKGIYVLTGHGAKHRAELQVPGTVVADIGAAADLILGSTPSGFLNRD